jgi:hypothetical protein
MENTTPSLEVYTCTFQKEVIFDDALIKSNKIYLSFKKFNISITFFISRIYPRKMYPFRLKKRIVVYG